MTIAITGATGQLGRLAIAALKTRGAAPIALARSPEKAADLGVEVRGFDYFAPDTAALQGVETLVLISSNDFNDRAGQHKAVIAVAKAAQPAHQRIDEEERQVEHDLHRRLRQRFGADHPVEVDRAIAATSTSPLGTRCEGMSGSRPRYAAFRSRTRPRVSRDIRGRP